MAPRAKGGCTPCSRTRSCQSAPAAADLSGARDSARVPESDREESAPLLALMLLNSRSNPGTIESMNLLALFTATPIRALARASTLCRVSLGLLAVADAREVG